MYVSVRIYLHMDDDLQLLIIAPKFGDNTQLDERHSQKKVLLDQESFTGDDTPYCLHIYEDVHSYSNDYSRIRA